LDDDDEEYAEFFDEDGRGDLIRRAKAADLGYEVVDTGSRYDYYEGPERFDLQLLLRNGRNTYPVTVDAEGGARIIEKVRFEDLVILGDYCAIYNRKTKTVEALLEPVNYNPKLQTQQLYRITGLEYQRRTGFNQPTETVVVGPGKTASWNDLLSAASWRLPIAEAPDGSAIEISVASRDLRRIISYGGYTDESISLKLSNVRQTTHDGVLEYLDDIASCILFELDLRYNVIYTLARRPEAVPRTRLLRPLDHRPLSFPKVKYAKTATTLYAYGRSTTGGPLVRYLAYYQAIEHFLPSFVDREVIERLKAELRDPRFNNDQDQHIMKLVRIAAAKRPAGMAEREQLSVTLERCLEDSDLFAYLDKNNDAKQFIAKKNSLTGVPQVVATNTAASLTNQLAHRIYAIRCRIVHTKDSRSDTFVEPLLPYSGEASRLQHDLGLIEFVCRKVIIAGSREQLR
jgi:hypothetical protein